MISYWDSWLPTAKYHEAPADEQSKLVAYRRHVANGTVPKSGIPYTLTGVEAQKQYREVQTRNGVTNKSIHSGRRGSPNQSQFSATLVRQ